MGKKAVTRCSIEVDGIPVDFFKNFKEHTRTVGKMVKLMGKSTVLDATPEHTFSIDYVKPKGKPINWATFKDGTVTVDLEDAERVTFELASTLSVGEYTADDENEMTQTIEFGAERRKEE
jgi:hypothetical protein